LTLLDQSLDIGEDARLGHRLTRLDVQEVSELLVHQAKRAQGAAASHCFRRLRARSIESGRQDMAAQEDPAIIAGQLADLTRTVEQMADQLKAFDVRADSQQKRADNQQERTETQQERIDLAARELAEVSDRLQAAANALRASI